MAGVAILVDEGVQLRCLTAQVRESYAILTRPYDKGGAGANADEAIGILDRILGLVPIFADRPEWLETWSEMVRRHQIKDLHAHDAYLAAAAAASGSLLVSADQGFRRYDGIDLRLL